MTVKLTIFDCDGVLVDSEIIACRVDAEELCRLGFDITPEIVAHRFIGSATKTMLETLQAESSIAIPADFHEHLTARVGQALATDLQPVSGIHAILDGLAGATCVASNSTFPRIEKSLQVTGLYDYFSPHIFSGAEHVENPKPAPDIYRHAARTMGVAPADCLVVEDTSTGVRAAVAAGIQVIGFTGGSHNIIGHGDRLLAEGAAIVVETMAELAPLLPCRQP